MADPINPMAGLLVLVLHLQLPLVDTMSKGLEADLSRLHTIKVTALAMVLQALALTPHPVVLIIPPLLNQTLAVRRDSVLMAVLSSKVVLALTHHLAPDPLALLADKISRVLVVAQYRPARVHSMLVVQTTPPLMDSLILPLLVETRV